MIRLLRAALVAFGPAAARIADERQLSTPCKPAQETAQACPATNTAAHQDCFPRKLT
jgi:hypothetical protein